MRGRAYSSEESVLYLRRVCVGRWIFWFWRRRREKEARRKCEERHEGDKERSEFISWFRSMVDMLSLDF